MMVLPVYGAMSTKAQQQIFMKAPPGVRKVVVATDIASTSLTVDGVVCVVCCMKTELLWKGAEERMG